MRMYKYFLLFGLMVPTVLKSQVPMNNVNFEFLGTGFLASINYERIIVNKEKHHFAGSIGIGASIADDPTNLPLTFTYNRGSSKHFLELGLGYTAILDNDYSDHFLHSVIGYKRIVDKGLSFKVRLTPIFFLDKDIREDIFILPWAGLSLGYSF